MSRVMPLDKHMFSQISSASVSSALIAINCEAIIETERMHVI